MPEQYPDLASLPEEAIAVSIITPVYNAAPFLKRTLDSVLNQTLSNIEHILVDDGSTDGSGRILDEYRDAHPERQITVIHQDNGGSAAAHDRGLQAAKGKYVAFLDADDYLEDNFCEALCRQALSENAEICRGECIMHKPDCAAGLVEPTNATIRNVGSRFAFWNLFWTAIYKRQLLTEHRIGFDPRLALGEDHLFLNEALLPCRHLALCDSTAYHYCIREGSEAYAGGGISPAKIASVLECYGKIAQNLVQVSAQAEELSGAAYALANHLAEVQGIYQHYACDSGDKLRCLLWVRKILNSCPAQLRSLVLVQLHDPQVRLHVRSSQ